MYYIMYINVTKQQVVMGDTSSCVKPGLSTLRCQLGVCPGCFPTLGEWFCKSDLSIV